jgi:translation elongation factor EF-Ts
MFKQNIKKKKKKIVDGIVDGRVRKMLHVTVTFFSSFLGRIEQNVSFFMKILIYLV